MRFDELSLVEPLLRAVDDCGYSEPTPIQEATIPAILDGKDLLGAAQTGTGKTAAFALPILDDLDYAGGREHYVLVLTPTRELAQQVSESFTTYGRHLDIDVGTLVGGEGFGKQLKQLARRSQVIVATPGRLLDHIQRGNVRFPNLRTLVLDEADRMLDMGFIHDVRRIVRRLPKERQTLLFSATLRPDVQGLARDILRDPVRIGVTPDYETAEQVTQMLHPVESAAKRRLVLHLLAGHGWDQVLIFARTKRGAETLAMVLRNGGVSVEQIHGDRSQKERNAALAAFKQGRVPVLVATDVASRGLDIQGISHVVNFDMPGSPEEYVHRIGRTGRAGAPGEAATLVTYDDWPLVREIERAIGKKIDRRIIPEFAPSWREPVNVGPRDWDGKGIKVVYKAFGSTRT